MAYLVKSKICINDETIGKMRDECVEAYKKAAGKRATEENNLRLTLEETLTSLKIIYGENAECTVCCIYRFGKIRYEFTHIGERKDPFADDNEEMFYPRRLMQRYGRMPSYRYRERLSTNTIILEAMLKPVPNKMLFEIMGAAVLALIISFLLKLLPEETQSIISTGIVNPFFNKLNNIISEIATPLVFFAVIDGITGMGNSASVGVLGKTFLKGMGISYSIAAVTFTLISLLFFPVSAIGNGEGSGDVIEKIVTLVLDIIPSNLVEGFSTDNDLQVIVISIFVGVAILSLGKKSDRICEAVSLLSDLVNKMMTFVCKLLPLIVFFGLINLFSSDASAFGQIYKVAIAFVLSVFVVVSSLFIRVRMKIKVPFSTLFKKQLPTTLINLTTSSQVAALPENLKCCKEKFGIDGKLIDFAVPLGIVVYMPNGAAFVGLTSLCVAFISGVPVDALFLIKNAIVAVIVAIAAPPIPGSAFAVMPIILSACGVPMDNYSVAVVLGTLLGYFLPVINGFSIQLEMLNMGLKLNKVNKETLLKKM